MKEFKRVPQKQLLGGVCAGIAYYIGIKVWIVRLLVALLGISSIGIVAFIYVLMWVLAPAYLKTPEDIGIIE